MRADTIGIVFDEYGTFELDNEGLIECVHGGQGLSVNEACWFSRQNAECAEANVNCYQTATAHATNDICAAPNVICAGVSQQADGICANLNGTCA